MGELFLSLKNKNMYSIDYKTRQEAPNIKGTCSNLIGLYQVIESVVWKAHEVRNIEEQDVLGKMRQRAWYFLYTNPKWMDDAMHEWVEFRNSHWVSVPLCLEDEIALIFYIYIYHDSNKWEHVQDLLKWICNPDTIESITHLCNDRERERERENTEKQSRSYFE